MGGVENPVPTDKAIRSPEKKQYSSNAESNPNKTEMKRRIEQSSNVRVVAINSHRPPGKGRYAGSTRRVRRKRMVITPRPNYPVPLFPGKQ
uniref:Ribosomal protein L23 n=2 Tax=Selaginella TaxID=3246 RepID=A0A650FGV7_9TRAC|nr:ribosomal protein L23 [Selaginella sanguinolenta]QBL76333.1 ribosomal protein L23 [Selaginella sanguinolenta]QGU93093.1 ribosomal protein L23 [Selaginella nummulariifolia]